MIKTVTLLFTLTGYQLCFRQKQIHLWRLYCYLDQAEGGKKTCILFDILMILLRVILGDINS